MPVLDDFSEVARRAMFVSRHNAFLQGSRTIEGHHLLQALIAENEPAAMKVLTRAGVLEALIARMPPIPKIAADTRNREIPLSEELRAALSIAHAEIVPSKSLRIDGAHLILGLLEAGGKASEIMFELGLRAETMRSVLGHAD